MKQDKQTKKAGSKLSLSIFRVIASPGHVLPLFYQGSMILIDDQKLVEIDLELLGYEPRIQFFKALDQKHIIETGA